MTITRRQFSAGAGALHWDYVFGPENSALRLKVATQPSEVHEVGSTAWLAIDPKLMVAIA